MTSIAIITDDASQCFFETDPVNVNILQIKHLFSSFKTANQPNKTPEQFFPDFLPLKSSPIISPPNIVEVSAQLVKFIRDFDEIFCITVTRGIDSIYSIFEDVSVKLKGRANFRLIDSQTLSAGQGYLVHRTIQLIQHNIPAFKIEEILREEIPGIYTLLCTPNLSYLYASGFVDAGQVISGEQYTLYPIFGLEDGVFTALEKQKNIHGAIEYFIEFISEYDKLKEVVFLHPLRHPITEAINLKQYMHENFPNVRYSEINCNEFMTHLIGPKGFGLIVVE